MLTQLAVNPVPTPLSAPKFFVLRNIEAEVGRGNLEARGRGNIEIYRGVGHSVVRD